MFFVFSHCSTSRWWCWARTFFWSWLECSFNEEAKITWKWKRRRETWCLGQQSWIHACHNWPCSWPWKHLEVSLPLPEKWRRFDHINFSSHHVHRIFPALLQTTKEIIYLIEDLKSRITRNKSQFSISQSRQAANIAFIRVFLFFKRWFYPNCFLAQNISNKYRT